MPTFTLTVTAGEGTRVMNALCAAENLEPTLANAQQVLRTYIVRTVRGYEYNLAMQSVAEPTPVVPT